jgi:hypothetical protein
MAEQLAEQPDARDTGEARVAQKKPYTTPQLVRHGTVDDLTQGGFVAQGGADLSSNL